MLEAEGPDQHVEVDHAERTDQEEEYEDGCEVESLTIHDHKQESNEGIQACPSGGILLPVFATCVRV